MGYGLKRNRTQWRDDLSRTSWQGFERLLAQHYRDAGYQVVHSGTAETAGAFDGGVDLVLRREGEVVLVQCKHWNAAQVPHNEVHQLLGLVETKGADRAILITSGEFTPAAREAGSRSRRIDLVDGAALRLMIDPRLIPVAPAPGAAKGGQSLAAWAPVAEKAIDAVMTLRGGRRWQRKARSPEAELKSFLLRFAVAAAIALVGFLFIRSQIQQLQTSLARPSVERRAASPPPRVDRVPVTKVSAASAPSPIPRSEPMSPEQLKEWEKKNAEAMEILERNVPSVHD